MKTVRRGSRKAKQLMSTAHNFRFWTVSEPEPKKLSDEAGRAVIVNQWAVPRDYPNAAILDQGKDGYFMVIRPLEWYRFDA